MRGRLAGQRALDMGMVLQVKRADQQIKNLLNPDKWKKPNSSHSAHTWQRLVLVRVMRLAGLC
jgi:hypothetical protein